jgi:hypothetical protein
MGLSAGILDVPALDWFQSSRKAWEPATDAISVEKGLVDLVSMWPWV